MCVLNISRNFKFANYLLVFLSVDTQKRHSRDTCLAQYVEHLTFVWGVGVVS